MSFTEDDFEVEVSAIQPGREEDDPLAAADWTPLRHDLSRRARARRLALVGGALLAALVILVGVPALRGQTLRPVGGAAAPTPGAGWFSYAPLTPHPEPGPGWTLAGPSYALGIVFAASAPETAYTCGTQGAYEGWALPLIVGVSRDAGHTWQTLSTPATGGSCMLTIDPTNALDVVLLAPSLCHDCASPDVSELYRSFDGGAHWSRWSLPPVGARQSADFSGMQWMWVGSTLFIAPSLVGDSVYARLAASVDRRPLVWLRLQGLFAGASTDASIGGLLAASTTLYIRMDLQVDSPTKCALNCSWYMQSSDGGASWSRFNPTFHGQPVSLLATSADGRTLLGEMDAQGNADPGSRVYLRSADAGASWSALPPLPAGLLAGVFVAAPDGAVYATVGKRFSGPSNGAQAGIYEAASGASGWRYAASVPPGGVLTLAWNEQGHPGALWGRAYSNDLLPGLASHRP